MEGKKLPLIASPAILVGLSLLVLTSCSLNPSQTSQSSGQSPVASARSAHIQGLLNQAYNYQKQHPGEETGYLTRLNAVLAVDPNEPRALKEKGYALIRSRHYADAAKIFSKLAHQINDPTVYLQLGYLYDVLKEKENALSAFRMAYRTSKTDSQRDQALRAMSVIRANMRNGSRSRGSKSSHRTAHH